jgi:glutathione S-transferase
MIDFYYWIAPNGHKVTIFLEESGVPRLTKYFSSSVEDGIATKL